MSLVYNYVTTLSKNAKDSKVEQEGCNVQGQCSQSSVKAGFTTSNDMLCCYAVPCLQRGTVHPGWLFHDARVLSDSRKSARFGIFNG